MLCDLADVQEMTLGHNLCEDSLVNVEVTLIEKKHLAGKMLDTVKEYFQRHI